MLDNLHEGMIFDPKYDQNDRCFHQNNRSFFQNDRYFLQNDRFFNESDRGPKWTVQKDFERKILNVFWAKVDGHESK